MTDKAKEGSIILWQENPDSVGEPALHIEPYSDVIHIRQVADAININYDNVDELCRVLKAMKRYKK